MKYQRLLLLLHNLQHCLKELEENTGLEGGVDGRPATAS